MNKKEIKKQILQIKENGEGGLTIEGGKISKRQNGYQVARKNYYIGKDIAKVLEIIEEFENVGVWFENNTWYIDESIYHDDYAKACINAVFWYQLAIFDWSTMSCIDIIKDENKKARWQAIQGA